MLRALSQAARVDERRLCCEVHFTNHEMEYPMRLPFRGWS